ncbi:NAD-dependent protein deacetylase sirtuin-3 [Bombina bombina]|uniref:NAD-dependent protein deacetylase sirtuin-3 n=1 Tax=Bombina bombina TaxID=8345 RepID=UPI00235AF439|nr:NAD-dependent protein deacetylase sirtuin-3 [Bombina bombina]
MESFISTLPFSTLDTQCIKNWQIPVMPALASVQKTESPNAAIQKVAITPICPPVDMCAKKRSRLPSLEKQNHPRRILMAKRTLAKKVYRKKSPPAPLKCEDLSDLILNNHFKNIIVMVGAGISTPSGIPDFRTPGTGLYDNLLEYNIPYPEAIFDIDYFTYNPEPFFSLAQELYPGKYKPNFVHYFVKLLHDKGLLLRCYTQNIDGLERMAGIPPEKLVEAHGTFSSASCHLCYTPFPAAEAQECIKSGRIPRCKICSGFVKPDIVFFGEDLPQSYNKVSIDFPKADLLIVMGTSLAIEPFASLVNSVCSKVPRLLLNRESVGPFKRNPLKRTDVALLGDLSDITRKFAHSLNWLTEIEEIMSHRN